jgi:hypothetical protein
VLFTMAIVLGLGSAFIEMRILKSVPLLAAWNRRSMAFGLALSFIISAAIGMLFGASGLVVMMAGVISTVCTEPIHELRRRMAKSNGAAKARIDSYKQAADGTYNAFVRPTAKASFFVIKNVTRPLWMPVAAEMKKKAA